MYSDYLIVDDLCLLVDRYPTFFHTIDCFVPVVPVAFNIVR